MPAGGSGGGRFLLRLRHARSFSTSLSRTETTITAQSRQIKNLPPGPPWTSRPTSLGVLWQKVQIAAARHDVHPLSIAAVRRAVE